MKKQIYLVAQCKFFDQLAGLAEKISHGYQSDPCALCDLHFAATFNELDSDHVFVLGRWHENCICCTCLRVVSCQGRLGQHEVKVREDSCLLVLVRSHETLPNGLPTGFFLTCFVRIGRMAAVA